MDYFLIGCLALLLLLYITDFSYWTGVWYVIKVICLILVGLSFAATSMLASKRLPGSSIAFFVLIFPGFIWLLKYALYRDVHTALFMRSISIALFLSSVAALVLWIIWIVEYDYLWNDATKREFGALVQCSNIPPPPLPLNDEFDCLLAWILWAAPFLAACNAFVFSILAWILAHSLRQVCV